MSERHDDPNLDADLVRRAKEAFDRSAGDLDAATRSRLTQARHRALDELPKPGTRRGWQWSLLPASAVAAAAVVMLQPGTKAPRLPPTATYADLEILLGEEDLQMYDEEIEFYAWLEEQPEFTPPAATGDGVG